MIMFYSVVKALLVLGYIWATNDNLWRHDLRKIRQTWLNVQYNKCQSNFIKPQYYMCMALLLCSQSRMTKDG